MNILDNAQLIDNCFQILVLFLQFYVLLYNVWKLVVIRFLQFEKIVSFDSTWKFLVLKLFDQNIRLFIGSTI